MALNYSFDLFDGDAKNILPVKNTQKLYSLTDNPLGKKIEADFEVMFD
jgi:hypothetical protein